MGRVAERQVWRGSNYGIENGLRWVDAPSAYGPDKTL